MVAFIKGSRTAPQCGFSYKVLSILQVWGWDFGEGMLARECMRQQ